MPGPRFAVVEARTDCAYQSIIGENLDEDMALWLMGCHREMAEGKTLWGADDTVIPYLSVMRWFMLPQQMIGAS